MMDAAGPAGKKRPYSFPLKADPFSWNRNDSRCHRILHPLPLHRLR
ncbi:hypothetical protein CBM2592_A170063 [Cupriavidus taiwanensis]|nr:hypothetical protein CBM2592_A170063 [Cupriavidus taiwanensis]SOY47130.1 hypothetical protein CBM2588_A130065 [Cupriavidus taiwanensis]SOZ78411.1 hypothetical protein CBM2618_A170064 [Cupriavidus taiwanensis]SOZ78628.1 hypothetical protein CBM2622_A160063 [Cupriavidus taiwanensis]SPA44721.1 hypothetical protein CBM2629_A160064 [Cupriavidus taiwanensis]